MDFGEGVANFTVDEHQSGRLLRLRTSSTDAMDLAVEILHFLESDFEAEVENTGLRNGSGLRVAIPVLIQLDCLALELTTDGAEVELLRRAGSEHEFDEICEHVRQRLE